MNDILVKFYNDVTEYFEGIYLISVYVDNDGLISIYALDKNEEDKCIVSVKNFVVFDHKNAVL